MPSVPVLLVIAASAMGGCRLIDQTSFGGAPQPPAPNALADALASHGTAPLLVIRPDDGVPYGDALRQVLETVEARDGDARFRLESVVPAQGDLSAQQAAMDANSASARQVMDDIGAAGINADRVTLGARTDLHLLRPEIRLYQS